MRDAYPGNEHAMSPEDMANRFSHLSKDMLQNLLQKSLKDRENSSHLLGGISSLLGRGGLLHHTSLFIASKMAKT